MVRPRLNASLPQTADLLLRHHSRAVDQGAPKFLGIPIIAGVLLPGRGWGEGKGAGGITNDTKPLQLVQLLRSIPEFADDCEENGVRIRGHFRGGKVEEIKLRIGVAARRLRVKPPRQFYPQRGPSTYC